MWSMYSRQISIFHHAWVQVLVSLHSSFFRLSIKGPINLPSFWSALDLREIQTAEIKFSQVKTSLRKKFALHTLIGQIFIWFLPTYLTMTEEVTTE